MESVKILKTNVEQAVWEVQSKYSTHPVQRHYSVYSIRRHHTLRLALQPYAINPFKRKHSACSAPPSAKYSEKLSKRVRLITLAQEVEECPPEPLKSIQCDETLPTDTSEKRIHFTRKIVTCLVKRIVSQQILGGTQFDFNSLIEVLLEPDGYLFLQSISENRFNHELANLSLHLGFELKYYPTVCMDRTLAEIVKTLVRRPGRNVTKIDPSKIVHELTTPCGETFLEKFVEIREHRLKRTYIDMLVAACGLLNTPSIEPVSCGLSSGIRFRAEAQSLVEAFLTKGGFFVFEGILNLSQDSTFEKFAQDLLKRRGLIEELLQSTVSRNGHDIGGIRNILDVLRGPSGRNFVMSSLKNNR